MAHIFPDIEKSRVIFASRAEESFYNSCKKLPNSWSVYYSCTLSSFEPDKGQQDNEIDFVLYHPKHGLFIVEVKGGSIRFDAEKNKFFSVNRHGHTFPIKNPFQQALVWKNRFVRYMKPKQIKVPATHLVCFPGVDENDIKPSASVQPELVIGRNRINNLPDFLDHISRRVHPEKFMFFQDVRHALDEVLKGTTYTTRLHIRDYIDNHELKVKDVELIHETLINPVSSVRRLAVEGEAGTGKTILALMLAKKFRDQGKSVLLLSSNPLLNHYMKAETGERVSVMTYSELASQFGIEILRRPNGFEGSRDDWIQYVGPERLKDAIQKTDTRYDVLLCDEAQDVQPFWWESLEAVLKDADSHFYIFFDRSQGVFGSGSSDNGFIPEDVLPIPSPYFPLIHNYRTTREIGAFSQSFRTGNEVLKSHSARLGYFPRVIVYEDANDAQNKLDELFTRLFGREGLQHEEVTVLSARRPFHDGSWMKNIKKVGSVDLLDIGSIKQRRLPTAEELKTSVAVSTISGFKGLETPVGIITNLSEYNLPLSNPIMASLFYVACTRAKHMLYIMVRKDDEKYNSIFAALNKLDHRGAMVVDSSVGESEFYGTVTHYNPDRVGWLKVEDPAFRRGHVMFFPHDVVKSKLSNLTVGMKLKFTTRVEGFTTIACDLRAVA